MKHKGPSRRRGWTAAGSGELLTLYHFTDRFALEQIKASGIIRMSDGDAYKPELDMMQPTPGMRRCVHLTSDPRHMAPFHGRFRVTVRVPDAHPYFDWLDLPEDIKESWPLARDWYVTERDIPREEWVAVEETSATEQHPIVEQLEAFYREFRETAWRDAIPSHIKAGLTNSTEIIPNLFVGGAQAEPPEGVSVIIDLLAEEAVNLAGAKGFLYVAYPMEDEPLIRSPETIRALGELIASLHRAGRGVFVRCYLGLNRSPLIAARALIALGEEPAEAIALLRRKRLVGLLYNPVYETWLMHEDETPSDSPCPLCRAERLSMWHHEDTDCWAADCIVCGCPMVVWREHGLPGAELERELLATLERIAEERFGAAGYLIDTARRQIPDHFHAHARPLVAGSEATGGR